jgi:hypothetical protein
LDSTAAIALTGWFFVSLAALAALFLVLRSRAALSARLIGLGVVLAIAAAWYGLLINLPFRDSIRTNMPGVTVGNPSLAEGLLRLAAILVLGGVVVGLLIRETVPVSTFPPERPHDVPPSV